MPHSRMPPKTPDWLETRHDPTIRQLDTSSSNEQFGSIRPSVHPVSSVMTHVSLPATLPRRRSGQKSRDERSSTGRITEGYFRASDNAVLYYRDWGPIHARPIFFHHGWPLSSEEWDQQMVHFLRAGFRVISFDRRGHGRSSRMCSGHDLSIMSQDTAELSNHLDLRGTLHVGHSIGGNQALAYAARYGRSRISGLLLISPFPLQPILTNAQAEKARVGLFRTIQARLSKDRFRYYVEIASGPFYGFNRPDADTCPRLALNCWRQAMMGSAEAHLLSFQHVLGEDQSADLCALEIPALVLLSEDDQIVPPISFADQVPDHRHNVSIRMSKRRPHGLTERDREEVSSEIQAFLDGQICL